MSEENVEIGRHLLRTFNEHGAEAVFELLHPDLVWHTDPLVPEAGVYTGREEVVEYLQGYLQAFGTVKFNLVDVIDLPDDEVLGITTFSGPLARTDKESGFNDWCLIAQFHEGRIIRIRSFLDRDRALEAAGLSE